MKLFFVVATVAWVGIVAGQHHQGRSQYYNPADREAKIIRYDNQNNGDGNYQYSYETSNGIAAEEQGFLKNAGTNNAIQTARGSYQYYGPDGQLYKIVYTADENGFNALGNHIPTPPPIPAEIQKSLDIIYANARKQQTAAGQNPTYFQNRNPNKPQGFFRPPQN